MMYFHPADEDVFVKLIVIIISPIGETIHFVLHLGFYIFLALTNVLHNLRFMLCKRRDSRNIISQTPADVMSKNMIIFTMRGELKETYQFNTLFLSKITIKKMLK